MHLVHRASHTCHGDEPINQGNAPDRLGHILDTPKSHRAPIWKISRQQQRQAGETHIMYVGRTHTIVGLQTRNRRKDGTENFGGFVYVLDGFPQRDFVLWVIMCSINFIIFCFSFVSLLCLFCLSFPVTTPRATTPHLYPTGYHALTTTARLSLLCIYPGYHAIVYFYSLVITPELSRSTTHVIRVITPAIVSSS